MHQESGKVYQIAFREDLLTFDREGLNKKFEKMKSFVNEIKNRFLLN